MTRTLLLLLALAGPAIADDEAALRDKVIATLLAGDAKALEAVVAPPVITERVWFADAACAKQFTSPKIGRVEGGALAALVRCVANAKPTRTPDTTWLNALTFEPGYQLSVITVEKPGARPMLQLAGALHDGHPVVPSPQVERQRVSGSATIDTDAVTKAAIDGDATQVAFTTVTYCIDGRGKVVGAVASIKPKAGHAAYVAHVLARVRAWTFKPFRVNGKAITVCTSASAQYPAGRKLPLEIEPASDEHVPAPPPVKVIAPKRG